MNNIYTKEQLEILNRYKKDVYPIDLTKGLNVYIAKDRNVEEDEEYMGIDPDSTVLCIQPVDSNNYHQPIYDILDAFFKSDMKKWGLSEFAETGVEFEGTEDQVMEWISGNPMLNFAGYN
jgi:hypothetical protein